MIVNKRCSHKQAMLSQSHLLMLQIKEAFHKCNTVQETQK